MKNVPTTIELQKISPKEVAVLLSAIAEKDDGAHAWKTCGMLDSLPEDFRAKVQAEIRNLCE